MEPSSSHKNVYNREDLLRYVSGQMTASEMHALEKAALEDPFLADAIEGLQQEKTDDTRKHFVALDQKLAARVESKVVPMPRTNWWRVAVAAALIGFLGLASYFFLENQESEPVIAQKKEQLFNDSTIPKSEELQTPASEQLSSDKTSGEIERKSNDDIEPKSSLDNQVNAAEIVKDKLTKEVPPQATQSLERDNKKELAKSDPSVAAAEKSAVQYNARENKPLKAERESSGKSEKLPGIYYFTGRITDNQNKPVPFANIAIRHTQRTSYSDAQGNFKVVAGDSTLEVDIKSIGFLTRTIELSNERSMHEVVLQPALSAKAKETTRKLNTEEAAASTEQNDITDTLGKPEAEPKNGFASYQFYLLNNVRIPADSKNLGSRGSVELSFLVNENGRLSDFRIERSFLGPAFEKEAIRLIREGPPWVLYNSDSAIRAKITVTF